MNEELINLAKETERILMSLEDNADRLLTNEMFKELNSYFFNEEEEE